MTTALNIFNASACISAERANIVFVFGRRDTGKTYATQQLIPHIRSEHTFVIGGKDADSYTATFPSAKVHAEYDSNVVADICRDLASKYSDGRKEVSSLLVIDNSIYDPNDYSKLPGLFCNARLWKTSVIFTTSYPVRLSPVIRAQADFVILLESYHLNPSMLDRIHDQYFKEAVPDRDVFAALLTKHGGLVVDLRKRMPELWAYSSDTLPVLG